MVSDKKLQGIFLTILAIIFTLGLTFASVELPDLLNRGLEKLTPSLEGDSHQRDAPLYKTRVFMSHYKYRIIGYGCFIVMILLIIAGFATQRSGLGSAGALLMFLPVFAQFAGVMFFLAGLGVLNLVWLPVLDISLEIGKMGDIVYLPYNLLLSLFSKLNADIHFILVYLTIGSGLLIFTLGTINWLKTRFDKEGVAESRLYRFSRHPQYLGWIIWSYGMLIALMRVNYPKRSWGIPASFPWLVSTMVIIGVAMMEELKMERLHGENYVKYRNHTPFLFPLPKFISAFFAMPQRLLFKKARPRSGGQVAVVLLVFLLFFTALSAVYNNYERILYPRQHVQKLVKQIRETRNGRSRYLLTLKLGEAGTPAVDSLIELLRDENPDNRGNAASVMADIKSPRTIRPLITALDDEFGYIRSNAAVALGKMAAGEAVPALIERLADESEAVRRSSAAALGNIGSAEAIDPLTGALHEDKWYNRIPVIEALGKLGSEKALDSIMPLLKSPHNRERREVVLALHRIGSPRSIRLLESALKDEDYEVRMFAAAALKKIKR